MSDSTKLFVGIVFVLSSFLCSPSNASLVLDSISLLADTEFTNAFGSSTNSDSSITFPDNVSATSVGGVGGGSANASASALGTFGSESANFTFHAYSQFLQLVFPPTAGGAAGSLDMTFSVSGTATLDYTLENFGVFGGSNANASLTQSGGGTIFSGQSGMGTVNLAPGTYTLSVLSNTTTV